MFKLHNIYLQQIKERWQSPAYCTCLENKQGLKTLAGSNPARSSISTTKALIMKQTINNYKGLPIDFARLEWIEGNNSFYANQGLWNINIDVTNDLDIVYVKVNMKTEPNALITYGYNELCNTFTIEYKIQELAFKTLLAYMKYQDPTLSIRQTTQKKITRDTVKGLLNVT